MLDGQFELDGFLFGRAEDNVTVLTEGLDVGGYEVRDQDVQAPMGDHVFFGRDYLTPPTWTFTLAVHHDTNAHATLMALAKVWRADTIRNTPGARSVLRYTRDGVTRRVYGRPRRFSVDHGDVMDGTFKIVTATFTLADNYSYADQENLLVLDLITTSSEAGLTFPTTFPWEFQSDGFTRAGQVTITTGLPTPFRVAIAGPVADTASNFKLSSTTGWSMEFGTYLSPHGNISVDTSTGIAIRNSVHYGTIRNNSDFRARLQPDTQEIVFTANDPTYTTTARITWRDVEPVL